PRLRPNAPVAERERNCLLSMLLINGLLNGFSCKINNSFVIFKKSPFFAQKVNYIALKYTFSFLIAK
ncbi:MAG: hypothetical protein IKI00_04970, partial [Bacteroidales bacterium]|nr:hypothetical protein [Bacteroidales bacterium]